MKIRKKAVFPLFIILYLLISEIFMSQINFLQYTDEICAIIFAVYIFIGTLTRSFYWSKEKKKIVFSCIIILFIGLVSNLYSGVQKNKIAIILDIVSNFKLIICSLGISFMVNKDTAKYVLYKLKKPAKVFLLIGFMCGIISIFSDIGMRGQYRYGIWGYNFIYGYAHIYSITILFWIIVISVTSKSNKEFYRYLFLAIIPMILTTKGPSIIWAASIVVVLYYIKRHEKIKLGLIIILSIFSIGLGGYQIQNYFMKSNVPRAVFYRYSFKTANHFLPFGSGYASFGSDMAAKYYSNLYNEYGFNSMYGMTQMDGSFLRDNYWPMILGQFGWIGLIIMLYILYQFFSIIQHSNINNMRKAIIFSAVFYTVLHSVGSSTFATSAAVTLYIGIVLAIKAEKGGDNYK